MHNTYINNMQHTYIVKQKSNEFDKSYIFWHSLRSPSIGSPFSPNIVASTS